MPYMTNSPAMLSLALRPADTELGVPANTEGANGIAEDAAVMDTGEDASKISSQEVNMEDEETAHFRQERSLKLKAKNRRKRYLETHPKYFDDSSLELADPLLYDRLIRRFQTAAEREAEGQRKGFSGQMSTDLWRAEAKKDALVQTNPHSLFTYSRGPNGEIREEDKDEVPMSKAEGKAWWIDEMTQRFLGGEDYDFDYKTVDGNDTYDDPEEERDIQDAYFESMESDFDSDGEGKEKVLTGETGIQDY